MKKIKFFGLIGLYVLCLFIINIKVSHAANIEVYPGPGNNAYLSNLYTVEVFDGTNWVPSYTYKYSRTSVVNWGYGTSPSVSFTTFGTDGSVQVRISKIGGTISNISVSPKSKNISSVITSGKATITLNKNNKAWIVIDNDETDPLFVFADEPKPAIPSAGPGLVYFGPGVTTINHLKINSGQVVYLDGGAWVRGNLDLRGTTNVQVIGPGVLSGDLWTAETVQALPTLNDKKEYVMVLGDWNSYNNASVKGITIVNSPFFNFFGGVNNVYSVKIISPWYYSTDGFQAVNHIDQSFAFSGDNIFFPMWAGINHDNVTITNSFAGNTNNSVICGGFWGNDPANTYTAFMDNIDIKTFGNPPGWGQETPAVFQIWVDNATTTKGYSNQTYQNIRVEGNIAEQLAQIKNMVYPWGGSNVFNPPLGNSYNLLFKNITLSGTQGTSSEIMGYDANNGFHNVTLDNIVINNTQVTQSNLNNYFKTNSFVTGLSVLAPTDLTPPTVSISSPTNNSTVSRNTTVTIKSNAYDLFGINKVEFYVNNILKCTDTTSAYSCQWSVPSTRNVVYNITAKAYDISGNTASTTIKVTSK